MKEFECGSLVVKKSSKEIEEVHKVRGLILNQKGQLLVTKNRGIYLLPGGTIEKGEEAVEALQREIKQETGITQVEVQDKDPLLRIRTWFDNPKGDQSKRRLNITDIYLGSTSQEVNLSQMELTEAEKKGNLEAVFRNITQILYFIENNSVANTKKREFDFEIKKAIELLKERKREKSLGR